MEAIAKPSLLPQEPSVRNEWKRTIKNQTDQIKIFPHPNRSWRLEGSLCDIERVQQMISGWSSENEYNPMGIHEESEGLYDIDDTVQFVFCR